MTKNILVHAFFDDATVPDGMIVDDTTGLNKVEPRTAHRFGNWQLAGDYVVHMQADADHAFRTVSLNVDLAQDGFVTWKSAAACSPDGASTLFDFATFSSSLYVTGPQDWTEWFAVLPAGQHQLNFGYSEYGTGAGAANQAWLSSIEVYEGDDGPSGQVGYGEGSEQDPNLTVGFARLQRDSDDSIDGIELAAATPGTPAEKLVPGHVEGANAASWQGFETEAGYNVIALSTDYASGRPVARVRASIDLPVASTGYLYYGYTRGYPSFGPNDSYIYQLPAAPQPWQKSPELYLPAGPQTFFFEIGADYNSPQGDGPGSGGDGEAWVSRFTVIYSAPRHPGLDASPGAVQSDGGTDPGGGGGGTAYGRGDFVRRLGGLYLARRDGAATEPGPGDSADWFEMVARARPQPLTYDQAMPSDEWTIPHPFLYNPAVAVVDSSGDTVRGAVTYPDPNTVLIRFTAAFSGRATLY